MFRPLDACYTPAWPALAEKAKVKDPMFFRTQVLPKVFCAWNLCQEGGIVWLQNINMCCP